VAGDLPRPVLRHGLNRLAVGETASRRAIGGQPVECEQRDVDRYGRIVAVCFNDDGKDVGEALVAQGWALAYREFSLDYVDEETKAQESGRGISYGDEAVNSIVTLANGDLTVAEKNEAINRDMWVLRLKSD
jgi:hypothetical protein